MGHGGSDAANPARVAVIDTASQTLVKELPVATHPEGLEIDNAKQRIFVNVADAAEVAVIDGKTSSLAQSVEDHPRAAITCRWPSMQEHNVLFVACRTPARLVVLDGTSGRELADLPSATGADDLFYDAELHRIYLIAGGGEVDVYEDRRGQGRPRHRRHENIHRVQKPDSLCPAQHALYVGVVAIGGKEAEIRVYGTH